MVACAGYFGRYTNRIEDMESIKEQIELLLKEGDKFTFTNFCYPNRSGREYGGEETPEWLSWKTRSVNLVSQALSDTSSAFKLVQTGASIRTEGDYSDHFERAKSNILKALQQTLDAIENDTFGELRKPKSENKYKRLSNKIFIVHGRDHALKTEIENFLHEIGLEPIVLHKKPDEGQTIIEKFEKHSDVGYAFVLLTPDEIAYLADQDTVADSQRKKEKRARLPCF